MRFYVLAACALSLAGTSAVQAQTYSGGSATFSGLGADFSAYPDTDFDTADFVGASGTYTGAGDYILDTVSFTAGVNRNDNALFSGDFSLTGLIGGNAFSYLVHYTGQIGSSDSITLGGNDFHYGGATFHLNELTLSSGGETSTGSLIASVSGPASLSASVPEPASWALMLGGFGMVGGAMRTRRKLALSFG